MEEDLNKWIVSIEDYRNLYHHWMRHYSDSPLDSIFNESIMWEAFHIYTENDYLQRDEKGNFVFKIKDTKKFSMARIKYDF